ncbi:hypothetical protein IIA79_03545 [bacterium]|nr:hypothetical protein [bacterium]
MFGAAGISYGVYSRATDGDKDVLEEGQQAIVVRTGDLVNEVSTNGSLIYPNRETLRFGIQGTIGEVLVEEGQAVKNAEGDAYIAEISHLSYWNCDDPIAPTLIKVKVVDMDGTLVPEATVVSAGVTYSGTTDQVTSANGMATFVVEQSAVERVSATYMGYFLGEKEVDTPSEYVTSYEAPLVATFTAPFDLAQLTIYAETDDGTPVPFAFVYLRDEGELWATELQAGEDSAARIHLIAGDTLSVWATDGVHASATQHLTIGDEEVIELHVAISDAIPLPVARFTISEYEGLAPMSIILDASASSPAGEITSYHWRVSSEGGTIAEATEADPQYELALPEPGHYIVNLELETASGSLDTERGAVCVY